MKIAFIGDSFCAHHGPKEDGNKETPEDSVQSFEIGHELAIKHNLPMADRSVVVSLSKNDWPYLVKKHFNAVPTYCGFQGLSFYDSFKQYINKALDEDYIIFCVTEPYRFSNKHNLSLGGTMLDDIVGQTDVGNFCCEYSAWEKKLTKEETMEIYVTAKKYKETITDPGTSIVMHNAMLNYVDNIMVEKNKKCLWFHSFDEHVLNWMKTFSPRSGPIGDRSLYSVGTKARELTNWKLRNHFTKEENIALSKLIIDVIENDRFEPGKISMGDWFSGNNDIEYDGEFIYP